MLKWLIRFLYVVLWGKPTEFKTPQVLSSNTIQRFTFGHVMVQIFLNHSRTGKPYYKLQFQRLVNDGRNRSNSFFVEDLADVERCLIRARAWMHDSKVVD